MSHNHSFSEDVFVFGLGAPGLHQITWPTNHFGVPLIYTWQAQSQRMHLPRRTAKRPSCNKKHPKDANQWPEGRIAKPKHAQNMQTRPSLVFFHSWVLQSVPPAIVLHLWSAFLHFGRFAVSPACLADALIKRRVRFDCHLLEASDISAE